MSIANHQGREWSIMRVSSRTRATDRQEFAGVPDFSAEGRTLIATISGKSAEWRAMRDLFLMRLTAGDTLIAYSLDRLSRGTLADSIEVIESLRDRGIGMKFIDRDCAPLSFEPGGEPNEMALAFFAAFARMERRKIAERTKESLAKIKAENPERLGRPCLSDKDLRDLADMRREGKSCAQIADFLGVSLECIKSRLRVCRAKGFLPALVKDNKEQRKPVVASMRKASENKLRTAQNALAAGLSVSAAARAAGCSRRSLYQWGVA